LFQLTSSGCCRAVNISVNVRLQFHLGLK